MFCSELKHTFKKEAVGVDLEKLTLPLSPLSRLGSQQVKWSVYLQYLRSMGWCYSSMVFFMYFIQNIAFMGSNLWLSDWTNDSLEYFNQTYPGNVRDVRVGVFGALGMAQGTVQDI